MRKQNDGKCADDILQNQFTAYLVTAVKRRKALYSRKKTQRQQIETPLELYDFELQVDTDLLTGLALLEQIENPMLHLALTQARERERYIFLTRILEERSFSDLAQELTMYRPLLLKESIIDGIYDEDLYQELCLTLLGCIQKFRV